MVEEPIHEGDEPMREPTRPSARDASPDAPETEPPEETEPAEDASPPERDIPDWAISRTAGEMLASERRRQGKSLLDIAESTRIRARLIEALEDGRYEQLPSPAYVKGYIQSYAAALGMPFEPFLEAYKAEPHPEAGLPVDRAALGEPIVPTREQEHAIPRGLLLAVGAAIAILVLIWVGSRLFAREPETQPLPVETTDVTETAAAPEATETVPGVTDLESLDATASVVETPGAFAVTVAISDDDSSWLRVTVDGEKVYEGILGEGSERTWDATDLVTIRIGRPTAVSITRDGEPVDIPRTGDGDLPTVEITAIQDE